MNASIARINEADLRSREAGTDADDRREAEVAAQMSTDEEEKARQMDEATKYVTSRRPTPSLTQQERQEMSRGGAQAQEGGASSSQEPMATSHGDASGSVQSSGLTRSGLLFSERLLNTRRVASLLSVKCKANPSMFSSVVSDSCQAKAYHCPEFGVSSACSLPARASHVFAFDLSYAR